MWSTTFLIAAQAGKTAWQPYILPLFSVWEKPCSRSSSRVCSLASLTVNRGPAPPAILQLQTTGHWN